MGTIMVRLFKSDYGGDHHNLSVVEEQEQQCL